MSPRADSASRAAGRAMPIAIVVNAGSGAHEADVRIAELRSGFGQAGRTFRMFVARGGRAVPGVAQEAAAWARNHGGMLVVAGGDGTINSVGRLAVEDGTPFGIVPSGTFNYVSRAHGIPQTMPEAIDCILDGVIREVQAGLLNDRMFFVNGSVGLYPQLLEDREAYKQRYGRSRLVALWSAIVTLLYQHRQLDVELIADGVAHRLRTPTLFVGNNRLQLEQVGVEEAPALDAGQLVALTAEPLTVGASLRLMARGLAGRLGDAPEVDHFAFHTMTVTIAGGRRRPVKIATDGEVARVRPPLAFSVSPRPLRLVVPRETASAQRPG